MMTLQRRKYRIVKAFFNMSSTKNQRTALGAQGESLAARALIRAGYTVTATHVTSRYGEIDIIAEKNERRHFIEVKTRKSLICGTPEEAVNAKKRLRMIKTIQWFHQNRITAEMPYMNWQIDVIAIYLTTENDIEKITHYANISA